MTEMMISCIEVMVRLPLTWASGLGGGAATAVHAAAAVALQLLHLLLLDGLLVHCELDGVRGSPVKRGHASGWSNVRGGVRVEGVM